MPSSSSSPAAERTPVLAVVVGNAGDPLRAAVRGALARRGFAVRTVDSRDLAILPLELTHDAVRIEGHTVQAVVFLADPVTCFSSDFAPEDRDFCDAEVRAVWLAIVNLPTVATITRWTPEEWASLGEWAIWRRRLAAAGVRLTGISLGASDNESPDAMWVPFSYGSVQRAPGPLGRRLLAPPVSCMRPGKISIWCCGEVVAGPDNSTVRDAAVVLEHFGNRLAAIVLDEDQSVLMCTSRPAIVDPALAHRVAERLSEQLRVDVHHR